MSKEKGEDIIAKISRPSLHAVFNRIRLSDLIDKFRKHPIIWITGVPGAGKSTLAASYIESNKLPGIWYQMDSSDNDPANFFYYMTLAAKKAAPRRKHILPKLSPENFLSLPSYAIKYFRVLFGLMNNNSVIVLDNYHEIPPGAVIHELISAGLEQAPSGLNIIILSRTGPPPAMTKLLVNGVMVKIDSEVLSLTEEESMGIAGLHDKWKSGLEYVPVMMEYTGGWTAGMVLMLEYGNPGEEAKLTSKEMAKEVFFNYFAGEIFNKMDPAVQNFLLMIACLPSFSPAVARELTAFSKASQVLADMNRKNYFTGKKVQHGTSYQFHPLFREFLVSRAEETLDPQQLTQLYSKAADILVEHGQPEEASHLYAKSGDHTAQADLIRLHSPIHVTQGRMQIVEQWLRRLPPEMLDSDPWLLFWYGQCRLPFDPLESRDFFIQAHDLFRKQNDIKGLILSISSTVETIQAEWGDFKQLDPWITELDNLMKDKKIILSADTEARAVFAMFSSLMFRQPHHPDMKIWERRMFKLLRSDMDKSLRLMAGSYLSHYFCWIGEMIQSRVVIDIMAELMKTAELSPLAFMVVKLQEAVHCWHVADFDMSLKAVREGLEEAERSGVHIFDNWLISQEVYASLFLDELERAKTSLDRIKPVLNSKRYLDISQFYYQSSLYHLRTGNPELALQHNGEALRYAQDMGTPFPEGLNIITAAQIHFETGNKKKAEELNNRARDIGLGMQSHQLNMLSYLNEAYFSLKTGRHERTREALRTALVISKDKGIINIPCWRSTFMTELYAEALRAGIEVDFVRDIIRRRGLISEKSSVEVENWPWQMKIYTLGRFETIIDGEPLRFKGKPQLKPLELLKALIALGGRDVSQNRLEDLLWPEADGDKSRQALITTLHRLRKIAGNEKVIELSDRKLSLNVRYCWVDVWALDNLYNKIDEVFASGGFDKDEVLRLTEMMLTLYRGDFLKDEDGSSWAWPVRTRLRSRFLCMIGTLARGWEKQGSFEKAVDLYLRGLEVDELAEEFYQGLMQCYQRQGRTVDGLSAYERCREVLSSVLQITPSPETEAIHLALRQGRARG